MDIKFSCPQCQQHIQCDSGYAGQQIACPNCNTPLLVPGTPVQAAPEIVTAVACPGCGAALSPDAALCTQCGYNLATGQRLQVQTQATPPPRPGAYRPSAVPPPRTQSLSMGNPNLVAGVILVIFVGLFVAAMASSSLAMVYVGLQGLFGLVLSIMILIAAFRESTGTGFMTLCIPCYALYFVFAKSESPMLKALLAVYLLVAVGSGVLQASMGLPEMK